MDRKARIILCAERTNINKHIKEHNKIKCLPLDANISEKACRYNCARAYVTRKAIRENDSNPKWMKTNWIMACLECERYSKPTTREIAFVLKHTNLNFGRETKDAEKRNMARTSSIERIISRLHDQINALPSPDSAKDTTIKSDPGEHGEVLKSNDIFDVGIRIEIDEDEI